VREPKVHRPVVGDSLTLHCEPPYGYPPGVIYWGESKAGDKLKPIENNERVSLDYEGTYSVALLYEQGCIYWTRGMSPNSQGEKWPKEGGEAEHI